MRWYERITNIVVPAQNGGGLAYTFDPQVPAIETDEFKFEVGLTAGPVNSAGCLVALIEGDLSAAECAELVNPASGGKISSSVLLISGGQTVTRYLPDVDIDALTVYAPGTNGTQTDLITATVRIRAIHHP